MFDVENEDGIDFPADADYERGLRVYFQNVQFCLRCEAAGLGGAMKSYE